MRRRMRAQRRARLTGVGALALAATASTVLEWVFTSEPKTPPLPNATFGFFPAACHYKTAPSSRT
jgi:hypothetical protein